MTATQAEVIKKYPPKWMVVMSKMLFHWENFSSFLHLSLNMVWRYKRYEKCHFPPCFLMFHMYYYCLKKRKNHAFDKRVFNTISSETFHGIIRFYLSATSGTTATRFPWKIGTPIGDIHNLFISTKVKYSDQRQLAKTSDKMPIAKTVNLKLSTSELSQM